MTTPQSEFEREFGTLSLAELEQGRPKAGLGLFECGNQNVLRYKIEFGGDIVDARNGAQVARLLRDPKTSEHIVCIDGRKPMPLPKPQRVERPPSAADRLYGSARPTTGSTMLTKRLRGG